MKLYEILLPFATNDGRAYASERADYLRRVAEAIGGYTVLPAVEGAWRDKPDPVSGLRLDYFETMIPVRVACEPVQWINLVSLAFVTFPDQSAIMHYVVSDAVTIQERPAAPDKQTVCDSVFSDAPCNCHELRAAENGE